MCVSVSVFVFVMCVLCVAAASCGVDERVCALLNVCMRTCVHENNCKEPFGAALWIFMRRAYCVWYVYFARESVGLSAQPFL